MCKQLYLLKHTLLSAHEPLLLKSLFDPVCNNFNTYLWPACWVKTWPPFLLMVWLFAGVVINLPKNTSHLLPCRSLFIHRLLKERRCRETLFSETLTSHVPIVVNWRQVAPTDCCSHAVAALTARNTFILCVLTADPTFLNAFSFLSVHLMTLRSSMCGSTTTSSAEVNILQITLSRLLAGFV